ncbi:MAG: hypothetical protein SPJ48_10900 [Hallella sp.]|nr:hypothetical protein [Hallella sp.]
MMTFTITDFLISLPITAIIIFAIKLVYKRAGISATPMGCLIGCLIMFWFVLCAIGGCSERKRIQSDSHLAHIKLLTTGAIVKIPKSELVGADTMYREKKMSIRMTQEEIWLSIWSNIRQTAKMRIIRQYGC